MSSTPSMSSVSPNLIGDEYQHILKLLADKDNLDYNHALKETARLVENLVGRPKEIASERVTNFVVRAAIHLSNHKWVHYKNSSARLELHLHTMSAVLHIISRSISMIETDNRECFYKSISKFWTIHRNTNVINANVMFSLREIRNCLRKIRDDQNELDTAKSVFELINSVAKEEYFDAFGTLVKVLSFEYPAGKWYSNWKDMREKYLKLNKENNPEIIEFYKELYKSSINELKTVKKKNTPTRNLRYKLLKSGGSLAGCSLPDHIDTLLIGYLNLMQRFLTEYFVQIKDNIQEIISFCNEIIGSQAKKQLSFKAIEILYVVKEISEEEEVKNTIESNFKRWSQQQPFANSFHPPLKRIIDDVARLMRERSRIDLHHEFLEYQNESLECQNNLDDGIVNDIVNEIVLAINVTEEKKEIVQNNEVTTYQSNSYYLPQCYEENYYITIDEDVECCYMQHIDLVELKEMLNHQKHLDDEIVNEVANEAALAINITEEEKENVQNNDEATTNQSNNCLLRSDEENHHITIDDDVEYCYMQHMDIVELKEMLNHQKYLDDEITFNFTKEGNGPVQTVETNEILNRQKHLHEENVSDDSAVNEGVEGLKNSLKEEFENELYLDDYNFEDVVTEEPTITDAPPPYEEIDSNIPYEYNEKPQQFVNNVQYITVIQQMQQHNAKDNEGSSFLKKVLKEVETIYAKAVEGHKAAINNIEKNAIESKAVKNVEDSSNLNEKIC